MRKFLWAALAVMGGLLLGVYIKDAEASRNSSGTYSLPTGNPVVSGQTISSTWANNTLSDLATEVTNSLDRNGRGAMLAPLQLSSGTAASPSLTFSAETGSGIYRVGAGDIGITISGTKVGDWKSTGLTATGLTSTGTVNVGAPTQTDQLAVQVNTANTAGIAVQNTNASSGAYSALRLFNDTPASHQGNIYYNSTGTTSFGGASSMNIGTTYADPVTLFTNNTARLTVAGAGGVTIQGGLTVSSGNLTVSSGTITGPVALGTSGTSINNLVRGVCTLNGSSPSTCTATVPSGSACVCSYAGTPAAALSCSVSATTFTAQSSTASSSSVNYICTN